MLIIQVVLTGFFFLAALKVIGRWKKAELSFPPALAWVGFWVIAAIVVLNPNLTARLAERVGIGRGADLVVYSALALAFFVLFLLLVKIERLNRDLTKVVRKLALLEKETKTIKQV